MSPPDQSHADACLIDALSVSLQMRDAYTRHHCDRVSELTRRLAAACDVDAAEREQVVLAARFHDIGKIGIPDAVLLSPQRLQAEERKVMQEHPARGEQIFLATGRSDAPAVARLIRAHHEAFDGSGYPDRLVGDAIPLGARILSVADSYDAMTSARPYRGPMPHQAALDTLDARAGIQFDPEVLRAFHTMLKRAPDIR